jgi:predicted nucleic acid-binding protein
VRFLDTNVLIYALGTDERAEVARTLVADGGVIAVQSLNEFTDVSKRKLKKDWPEVAADIEALLITCTVFERVTVKLQAEGRRLADRYGLRIFDAILVATALEASCDAFISEDLQDGMVFEGRLAVSNPFA